MELCPLAKVQHRIQIGAPLPFSIRDSSTHLLLAKDQIVANEDQLEALLDRGAFVDLDELRGARAEVYNAPPELLPSLWRTLGEQLSRTLMAMPNADAPQNLDDAARCLAALAERAPDLAMFLLIRPDHSELTRYGVVRSLHAATAALLVARRAGWAAPRCLTLVKAGLTMNLGMLDLQERLSNQARLITPSQRQAIHAHPQASVAMLRESGVVDADWLRAVAQHHEIPGGGGYPARLATVDELASALRTVDVYTSKLAGRSGRDALGPDRAVRDVLMIERGNPFALALVSEFGLYPPGSIVRLHSGEVAVVIHRTEDAQAPQVAVLMSRRGEPLLKPVQRQAMGREHGIAGVANAKALKIRITAEQLYGPLHA